MKKTLYYYLICLSFTLACSCSQEDSLKPSGVKEDYFTIPADATDPISILRREFHDRNGIHLLFNDTLRHEQRGTFTDGTPFWFTETIDLAYNITNTSTNCFFDYLHDQTEMETGIHFVESYILPHLGQGLRPYSIFLPAQIYADDGYGNIEESDFVNNIRCLAISIGSIISQPEENQKTIAQDMFYTLINDRIKSMNDQGLEAFYAHCDAYYRMAWEDCILPESMNLENLTQEDYYMLGFLEEPDNYWMSFPYKDNDLEDFLEAIIYTEESVFKEMYAGYPVLIAKYDTLKQIVINLGYKF